MLSKALFLSKFGFFTAKSLFGTVFANLFAETFKRHLKL